MPEHTHSLCPNVTMSTFARWGSSACPVEFTAMGRCSASDSSPCFRAPSILPIRYRECLLSLDWGQDVCDKRATNSRNIEVLPPSHSGSDPRAWQAVSTANGGERSALRLTQRGVCKGRGWSGGPGSREMSHADSDTVAGTTGIRVASIPSTRPSRRSGSHRLEAGAVTPTQTALVAEEGRQQQTSKLQVRLNL